MIRDIKLGFKMLKYGLQFKTMVAMIAVFGVAGILFEVSNSDMGNLGGIYLALVCSYFYQMVITSSVSSFVTASPMKAKIQTIIPTLFSFGSAFIGYSLFVVCRIIRINIFGYQKGTDEYASLMFGFILVGIMNLLIQIYNAFAYKYFMVSMIGMMVLMLPLMTLGMNDYFLDSITWNFNLPISVIMGLVLMIMGSILQYVFSKSILGKELDPRTYKSALSRSGR